MGTKQNPGAFDCYENAAMDEPMFVLLARDADAPVLVDLWALLRERDGESPDKVQEARDCADAMRGWTGPEPAPVCDGSASCQRHPGARAAHYVEHFDGVEHVYPGGKTAGSGPSGSEQ